MKEKTYDLEDRLIDFVLSVDDIVEKLPETRLERQIASQMIRSGSSPCNELWRSNECGI